MVDPKLHPPEQLNAVVSLFDGELVFVKLKLTVDSEGI